MDSFIWISTSMVLLDIKVVGALVSEPARV